MDQVQELLQSVKRSFPTQVKQIENYISILRSTSQEEIVEDFLNLRVTPVTVTIGITAVTTLIVLGGLLSGSGSSSSGSKKKKKPKKKVSKAQKANTEIQAILDFVEKEYVPKIDEYIETHKSLSKEDKDYKYNYFEEMLLKQLMKLDGIDVVGNDILRDNRKKVIKFIQDHQKRLDKVKKDNK